jgi:hypothetical protein
VFCILRTVSPPTHGPHHLTFQHIARQHADRTHLPKLTCSKSSLVCNWSSEARLGHHCGTNIIQSILQQSWNMLDSQGCACIVTYATYLAPFFVPLHGDDQVVVDCRLSSPYCARVPINHQFQQFPEHAHVQLVYTLGRRSWNP